VPEHSLPPNFLANGVFNKFLSAVLSMTFAGNPARNCAAPASDSFREGFTERIFSGRIHPRAIPNSPKRWNVLPYALFFPDD
jgi:hypothetical protein